MDSARRQWVAQAASLLMLGPMAGRHAGAQEAGLPHWPTEWAASWQLARRQGSGRLSFLGLAVYDAQLWVLPGWRAERFAQHPLILDLGYLRALSGERIAERSLVEMQRSGRVSAEQGSLWLARMKALFPDVRSGDHIVGWLVPGEAARFALNGRVLGEVQDASFAELFFGIWLAPWTSEPALRTALIGGANVAPAPPSPRAGP